jgi:hypothetical protein
MIQTADRQRRIPISSRWWCEHFQRNAEYALQVPADRPVELTEAERQSVAASIQTFQLGESGQGRHLLRVAREYAAKAGDDDYVEAMRLFIREEQRHGEYLGAFLEAEGIPRIGKQWTNGVFYWLRHLLGLELTISILLTAELIAMVYYAALRQATNSSTLRAICERIVKDEAAHIVFQTDRLALLRTGRAGWFVWFTQFVERCFFHGTSVAVWWTHGSVFRTAGIGPREFHRRATCELRKAHRLMNPCRIIVAQVPVREQVRMAGVVPASKTGNAGFLSEAN